MRCLPLLLLAAAAAFGQDCNTNGIPDGDELQALGGGSLVLTGLNTLEDGVLLHDCDGDGDLDILPRHTYNSSLRFYRNNGSAYSAVTLKTSWYFVSDWEVLWAGDFYNDGRNMVLFSEHSYGSGGDETSRLFIRELGGSFLGILGTRSPSRAAVGDVDGDGDLDVTIPVYGTYLQEGAGFVLQSTLLAQSFLRGVLLDWDLDGDVDFVYSIGADLILKENVSGTYIQQTLHTAGSSLLASLEILHEPGDTFPDLVTVIAATGEPLVIHNTGGVPSAEVLGSSGLVLNGIHVRELDGDGCPDLLGTRADNLLANWSCATDPPFTHALDGLAGRKLLQVAHDNQAPGWHVLGRTTGSAFARQELNWGDSNGNGIPDDCDIADSLLDDCDDSGLADNWEIAAGFIADCNGDGIADSCQPELDSDEDGIPDVCQDCNGNGLPDGEEGLADCNTNGIPDTCELDENDCNTNGILDACEGLPDCNANGIPDACELAGHDCDGNGVLDECQLGWFTEDLASTLPAEARFQADLDQDGIQDLLTAGAWYRRFAGTWSLQSAFPGTCLGVGDVNRDGRPDPVIQSAGLISWLDPANSWLATPVATMDPVTILRLQDMDGDGRTDFVCRTADRWAVYYNKPAGITGYISDPLTPAPFGWGGLEIGDMTGDGMADVVTASVLDMFEPETGHVSVYQRQTLLSYDEQRLIEFDASLEAVGYSLRFADTDGDGQPEPLSVHAFERYDPAETQTVFEGGAAGSLVLSEYKPSVLLAMDLDGDGAAEVLTRDFSTGGGNGIWNDGTFTNLGPTFLDHTTLVLDADANGTLEFCRSGQIRALWPQDGNGSAIPDVCEITQGQLPDCNGNGTWDALEVGAGTTDDRNRNGVPDICETIADCDANGVPDEVETPITLEIRDHTWELLAGSTGDVFMGGITGDLDGDGDTEIMATVSDDPGYGSYGLRFGLLESVEGEPVFTPDTTLPGYTWRLELFPWPRPGNRADGFLYYVESDGPSGLFLRDSIGVTDVALPIGPGGGRQVLPADLNGDGSPDVLDGHDGLLDLHLSDGQGGFVTHAVDPLFRKDRMLRWLEPGNAHGRILSLDEGTGQVLSLALVFGSVVLDTLDLPVGGFSEMVTATLPGGGIGVLLKSDNTGRLYTLSSPLDPESPFLEDQGSASPDPALRLVLSADLDGDGVQDPVLFDPPPSGSFRSYQARFSRGPDAGVWQEFGASRIQAAVVGEFHRPGRPELLLPGSRGFQTQDVVYESHLFLRTVGRSVLDHDGNGEPDVCQLQGSPEQDCDQDGVFDAYQLATGSVADCNGNGVQDGCDLVSGFSQDQDGNGVPDECESLEGCVTLQIARTAAGQVRLQWSSGEGCPPLHGPFRLLVSDDPGFPGGGSVIYTGHGVEYLDSHDPGTGETRCYRLEAQR